MDPEANIIFGAVIDESFKDQTRVTVIATGFDKKAVKAPKEELPTFSEEKKFSEIDIDIPAFLRRRRSGR